MAPTADFCSLSQLLIEGDSKHNRLEIKIRTSEGQVGNIQVIILPRDSQACQNIEVPLKPLNLHQKVNEMELSDLLSTIKIKSKKGQSKMTFIIIVVERKSKITKFKIWSYIFA